MLASDCQNGSARDGSTRTIRVAGFNGIAATMSVAAYLTKTDGRSDGGSLSVVILRNCVQTANRGTGFAGLGNGKPCSSGRMTVA
jgi:hypothetical protein